MNVDNSEPYMEGSVKPMLLRALVPVVSARVGRSVGEGERRALGFIIEKKGVFNISPEQFMQETFGLTNQDKPREVSLKVHNVVYQVKTDEIERRIGEARDNQEEQAKLAVLKELIEKSHQDAADYFGGVPDYWVPEWVKEG